MPYDELALIKLAKSGDVKAFEQLIASHQKFAYNIALRTVKSCDDAQDITQDAFVKAFTQIDQYRENSKFSTWMYRIVVNTCYDFLRKQSKISQLSLDDEVVIGDDSVKRQTEDVNSDVASIAEAKSLKLLVKRSIEKLPFENRVCVILRDINGLSYEEVSQVLEIPLGTVKSRLKRGRDMLRQIVLKDPAYSQDLL